MFDGVPHDQLHQFIVSSRSAPSSLPLPFSSFPLHQTSFISSPFDPFHPQSHPHHQLVLPLQQHHQQQPAHHFVHPIFHQSAPATNNSHKSCINEEKQAPNTLVSPAVNLPEIERERSVLPQVPDTDDHPWSNDEVLALLRIRSPMESWLPDFTWEHVSGKLSELGFKRSGEKCKEKFEEESRYFDNINNYTKSCRFLSELEELYHSEENPHQNHNNDNNNSSRMNIGTQKSQIRVLEIVNPYGGGGGGGGGGEDHDPLAGDSPTPRNDRDDTVNGAKESERGFEVVEEKAEEKNDERSGSSKKRKREKIKFEMFKGFCEEIVNKMMYQQEEMHNKLLEDMVKRDKEKVEKEEARKKQEEEKMNKELEIMAHEQAIAGDRQATIIEFLKKFISSSAATSTNTSTSSDQSQFSAPLENRKDSLNKAAVVKNTPNDTAESPGDAPNPNLHESQINNNVNIVKEVQPSSTVIVRHQNSTLSNHHQTQNPSGHDVVVSDIVVAPSTTLSPKNPKPPSATANKVQNDVKDDVGKRWPRDEVLALINLRCNLYNSGESDKDRQGNSAAKAPLWERISQGMSELGYKRSAKRCKEKWENINKYFRKTKDVNKKRSVDSRTCPYFHRLSTLYSKGTLVAPPSEGQEFLVVNHDDSSQLGSDLPPDHTDHHHGRNDNDDNHVAQPKRSENNVVVLHHHHHHHHQEVPAAFDFEF